MSGRVWDRGMQPERTALAWRRASLAFAGASLLVARVLVPESTATALVVAALGAGIAIALLFLVERRYRSHHLRLTTAAERAPLAGGALPLGLAALTVGLGIGSFLAVLLGP